MLRRQVSVFLGFFVVGCAFIYGVVHLFSLRSAAGDNFPAYSTLRADPLGAKALLDSLNEVPEVTAWSNFLPLTKLRVERQIALFYLNLPTTAKWEKRELEHFELMVAGGTRSIFAFAPEQALRETEMDPRQKAKKSEEEQEANSEKAKAKDDEGWRDWQEKKSADRRKPERRMQGGFEGDRGISFSEAATKLGFTFKTAVLKKGAPREPLEATLDIPGAGLEPAIPWHSALSFSELSPDWKVLYKHAGRPVVIERRLGAGSIVLAADSYFLSNEALREKTRAPKLLAWLVGGQRMIAFDEEHLGISEGSGVATLAKKYGLHGLVAALAFLAILFLWQNVVRFVPPRDSEEDEGRAPVSGRSSSEGFLSLLRRSVPVGDLMSICATEWRRTAGNDSRTLAKINTAIPEPSSVNRRGEILAAYAAAVAALRRGGK